jgi:enoyl-CoA hydratase/carnithine racemase
MSEEEKNIVTYELEGEIALVGLNRPDKRNCFNPDVMKALRAAIERAGEEAKCGIIFGHGDNFCAGLDLRWAAESWKTGRSERLPFQFNRNSYFEVMARGNIPFIAALHGATLGGGLETAAAAHIRVADETTFFGLPEGTRGIFIGGGGSVRVARLIGFARMQDMMLTGRVLKADEAERYGIVQYIVPKGQQLAKAKELALKICKNAPLSNFAITNSLPRLQDMNYDDGLTSSAWSPNTPAARSRSSGCTSSSTRPHRGCGQTNDTNADGVHGHSGARAKLAKPESILRSSDYGFRVRADARPGMTNERDEKGVKYGFA